MAHVPTTRARTARSQSTPTAAASGQSSTVDGTRPARARRARATAGCIGDTHGALVALVATLVITASIGCGARVPPARPFAAPRAVTFGATLAVVGDLQRTAPVLELWREQNDAEREVIVRGIADARPDLLAITGDCVFDGSSEEQWAAFDALTEPIRAAGVPAIAALGNHEYWLGRGGEAHLFARFPHLRAEHWYAVAFGPLRLVVLDSNDGRLGEAAWAREALWYEAALTRYDADPAVRGVLVLLHHPPYTNSTVTSDEERVQRAFVPAFMRANKTLAMLSGHVHSYERFARGGKMFVVSGGGGGPRAKLLVGDARRHKDDLFEGPAVRDFHFTLYTVTDAGVSAEVRGVAKGGTTLRTMDAFALPWAR